MEDVAEPGVDDAATPAIDGAAGDLPDDGAGDATGVPSVDAAIERLGDLDATPVEGHVEIFDDVQRRLHDALAELDDGQ
ncbi:MAG TPA: hypothetical protein VHB18_14535 [Mycobacteriales bacterium]|nr:hypothetical protein [Mycobacteriales bacterium]